MKTITLQGLDFEPYITKQEIAAQVKRVAAEINDDLDGDDAPLFICVLNGAFIFAADLYREVNLPHSQITFIRYKSYDGMCSLALRTLCLIPRMRSILLRSSDVSTSEVPTSTGLPALVISSILSITAANLAFLVL